MTKYIFNVYYCQLARKEITVTVAELITQLSQFNPKSHVLVNSGPNGSGSPYDLNQGPISHTITEDDANSTADCENRIGEQIVLIGFGCF